MVSFKRVIFLLLPLALLANEVEVVVSADSFFADEKSQTALLSGNVKVQKGKFDSLTSNKLEIYFDKEKNPTKFIATGSAKFKALIKEKSYQGSADELVYDVVKNLYILKQNAHLKDLSDSRDVYGEQITINQTDATYKVDGNAKSKEPAKLIFKFKEPLK